MTTGLPTQSVVDQLKWRYFDHLSPSLTCSLERKIAAILHTEEGFVTVRYVLFFIACTKYHSNSLLLRLLYTGTSCVRYRVGLQTVVSLHSAVHQFWLLECIPVAVTLISTRFGHTSTNVSQQAHFLHFPLRCLANSFAEEGLGTSDPSQLVTQFAWLLSASAPQFCNPWDLSWLPSNLATALLAEQRLQPMPPVCIFTMCQLTTSFRS